MLGSLPSTRQIRVMVTDWRLRGNIIRTAACWVVWHNVHSQQHTHVSSSYRSSTLGLSHWDPYTMHRGGCSINHKAHGKAIGCVITAHSLLCCTGISIDLNQQIPVNPFSTWRLHVAWMYIWRVCTRAARKQNPNPNSHGHCLLSKCKCCTCAHTHL